MEGAVVYKVVIIMKLYRIFLPLLAYSAFVSASNADNLDAIQACLNTLEKNESPLLEDGIIDSSFQKAIVIRYSHSQYIWLRFVTVQVDSTIQLNHMKSISCAVDRVNLTVSMLKAPEYPGSRISKIYIDFNEAERESEKASIAKLGGADFKIIEEKSYLYTDRSGGAIWVKND